MDRIAVLFQVLDRQHDLIRRSDAKLLITIPTATAMLGGFALTLANTSITDPPSIFLYLIVSVSLLGVYLNSFLALNPSTSHPGKGKRIYAGHIVNMTIKQYTDSWGGVTNAEIQDDIASQIHINSSIAMRKLKYISRSLLFLLFSLPLWTFAIYRASQ